MTQLEHTPDLMVEEGEMAESVQRFGFGERVGGFQLGSSPENSDSSKSSFIAKGLTIAGEVRSEGTIVIEGEIDGAVTASEVVVSRTGKVSGPIIAHNVSISGEVQGAVTAKNTLSLMAGSKVVGDLETAQLSVEKGAVLRGQCKMSEAA